MYLVRFIISTLIHVIMARHCCYIFYSSKIILLVANLVHNHRSSNLDGSLRYLTNKRKQNIHFCLQTLFIAFLDMNSEKYCVVSHRAFLRSTRAGAKLRYLVISPRSRISFRFLCEIGFMARDSSGTLNPSAHPAG